MAGAMKPAVAVFASLLLGSLPSAASFKASDWKSIQLPAAGGTNSTNQWFFFPDENKAPRIVSKVASNQANVARITLTGGPPDWTATAPTNTAGMDKEGFFVQSPLSSETGFLVGVHRPSGENFRLRMWSFANGSVGNEVVDPEASTVGISGISAAVDPQGNLHVAWVWSPGTNESLCYRRRSNGGTWDQEVKFIVLNRTNNVDNGVRVGQTAVVPTSFNSASIYFTQNTPITQPVSGTVTSLRRTTTILNGGQIFLTSPETLVTAGVKHALRGFRMGSVDRIFYFEGDTMKRRIDNGTTAATIDVGDPVTGAIPEGIHAAISPVDGRQRIAWYDSNSKKIYYLRPNAVDVDYTQFNPITITGNGAADLYGLHFDSTGLPYILYRRAAAEGYVAIPNDNFDFDGNGRADVIDDGFGSTKLGVTTLPVIPPASNLPTSGNKFKIQFPTVGSASTNGLGAVVSKAESNESLKYELEVSTDGVVWTKITSGAPISYSFVKTGGSGNNETRTCTGVFSDPAPGSVPKRFARVIVTRTPYPY